MSGDSFSSTGSTLVSAHFKKRKSRFTFFEVQLLLTEVKKNRHILVGKFNQGVSSDVKKRTWAALAARINEISECRREVIEIVKKWSDLKCDTKRKVAAMRASGFSAARITDDLSPFEKMVHQILQPNFEERYPLSDSIADEDDDSEGAPVTPLDMSYNYDSAVPLTDLEPLGTEDKDLQVNETEHQSNQNKILPDPPTADRDQIKTEPQPKASSNSTVCAGSSSRAAACRLSSRDPGSLQERLAKSASLSLQEQQATTVLIGALSRSLESVAESVQWLVQTQQQFARDTLRLQRDTLHVLRDLSSSALSLMQDKSNGHS